MPKKIKFDTGSLSGLLLETLNHKFGDGTATANHTDQSSTIVDYISTQCYALDLAIGKPGIPCGRLTVIQGAEGSAKTSVAMHLLAECQRRGGMPIYFDMEYAWDADRASRMGLYDEYYIDKLGLTVNPLIVVTPDSVEKVFEALDETIAKIRTHDSDILTLFVWDSAAATPSQAEVEGKLGDIQPGIHARLFARGLRKTIADIAEKRIALVVINQEKEKISFGGFGPQTATIAQKPLGFHASVRIVTSYIGTYPKDRKISTGIKVRAKITKNKIAPPFREAEFTVKYDDGIDDLGSRLELALAWGLVKKMGAFYKYGETSFYAKDFSKLDEKVRATLLGEIDAYAATIRGTPAEVTPSDVDDDGDEDEDTLD